MYLSNVCSLAWIVGFTVEIYLIFIHGISNEGLRSSDLFKSGGLDRCLIAFVTVITTLVLPVVVMVYAYGYII